MRSGPSVCIPGIRELGEPERRRLAAPADSVGVSFSLAALALPLCLGRRFFELELTSLAFLLASSNLKQRSTVCPGLPQKAQTNGAAGAAVFGAKDEGAATAAAAATPTLCASSVLRASSTCCTDNSDCASREVVRAEYWVLQWQIDTGNYSLLSHTGEF